MTTTARWLVVLGTAAASVSTPLAGFQGPARPSRPYLELVETYAAGRRAEAVAALGSWSAQDLKSEVESVRRLAEQARACPDCPAGRAFEALPLPAAVLLHTDRDVEEATPDPEGEEFDPTCGRRVHDVLAERLLGALLGQPERRSFGRRWYLAMILRTQWDLCYDDAAYWTRGALKWFPGDAELLLARGTAEEVAELRRRSARVRPGASRQEVRDLEDEGKVHRMLLAKAERSFEEAVAADREAHEAWLRLGRVRWRVGKREEARTCLETVVTRSSRPDLLYLGHLFLGRVHQDAGRLPEAEAEYRRALASDPTAQSAGVALSHVLLLEGDAAGSREVLERTVRNAGRREGDGFWRYPGGHYPRAETLLDELRAEAKR